MTTPEPRVRVHRRIGVLSLTPGIPSQLVWGANCECGWRSTNYRAWRLAVSVAHDHTEVCPALHLAALIRELKALRDRHRDTAEEWFYSIKAGTPPLAKGFRMGETCALTDAADLTALIDRATDGGTGC